MHAFAPDAPASQRPLLIPPGDGQVNLWLCSPSILTDELRAAYHDLLNEAERRRLARFRVAHAADEFLLGRALLRSMLSAYAPVDPRAWEFEMGPHGKPALAGPALAPRLGFNLSHTSGLVVCAVAAEVSLGVDVEHCGRQLEMREFSAANFAPIEQALIDATDDEALSEAFFQLWTLKEAYIKALGLGLNVPLDSFWFDLADPLRLGLADPEEAARWRFAHEAPTAEHRLSVALAPAGGADLRVRSRWCVPGADQTS